MENIKSPEETLKEIDRVIEQQKLNAEKVRKYIAAKKEYEELQKSLGLAHEDASESPPVLSKEKVKKTKSKKKVTVMTAIVTLLKNKGRFLKFSEILDGVSSVFPDKTRLQIFTGVRDSLQRAKTSKKSLLAYLPNNDGSKNRVLYGLKEFLNENGKPKPGTTLNDKRAQEALLITTLQ